MTAPANPQPTGGPLTQDARVPRARLAITRTQRTQLIEAVEQNKNYAMRGTHIFLHEEASAILALMEAYGFESVLEAIRFAVLSVGGTGDAVANATKIRIRAEVNDSLRHIYNRAAQALGKLADEIAAEGQ